MGEVVKHAAIADESMFAFLEDQGQALLNLEPDAVLRAVSDSIRIKAEIVNRDELEKGERRKLNFGHTYGHAVEKTTPLAHGEAVSVGMVFAARLSVEKGLLAQKECDRLIALLKVLEMPTEVEVPSEAAIDALLRDKKRTGDTVHFVLLEKIGKAVVKEMAVEELVGMNSGKSCNFRIELKGMNRQCRYPIFNHYAANSFVFAVMISSRQTVKQSILLADEFNLSDKDRKELLPSGRQAVL